MGFWFTRFFERQGLRVLGAGLTGSPSPAELARRCDVLVISVPIAATLPVIRDLAPLVRPGALLTDLTSIKAEPVREMLARSDAQVVGGHPLFGPEVKAGDPLRMALCPGRGEQGLAWLQKTLQAGGIATNLMTPEEHDRRMGLVQGLLHFANIVMARCLADSGLSVEELESSATPNFQQALDRIEAMLHQPAELFEGLVTRNPSAEKAIAAFLETAHRFRRPPGCRDTLKFEHEFQALRTFFRLQPDSGDNA